MAYDYDRRIAASDVQIHSVEFASGQEPDDAIENREDFVTLVRVDFTVGGPTLARLLEKQDRVVEKALKDLKPTALLNRAQDSQALLRELTPAIKRMVQSYVSSEGARAGRLTVDFASEGDLAYSAKADATKKEVRMELEFDVEGTLQ